MTIKRHRENENMIGGIYVAVQSTVVEELIWVVLQAPQSAASFLIYNFWCGFYILFREIERPENWKP